MNPSSRQWQGFSSLRPRLYAHVRIYPQQFRGKRWYVLNNQASNQFLRINDLTYAVVSRMDGEVTLQEIRDELGAVLAEGCPTEEEIIRVLAQLSTAEILSGALPEETRRIMQSQPHRPRRFLQQVFLNPLAVRVPIFDPDPLLERLLPIARPLFSGTAAFVWTLVVGLAMLTAIGYRGELGADFDRHLLSPQNLIALWFLFPLLKVLHELGHGLTVKAWGGRVQEMGFTLFVLLPVPYVDASASWAFPDKRKRAMAAAAGILVELFLAAVAFFVWLNVESGLVRDLALDVAVLCSLSTLLVNGNPLVKFDAYYVLEDLIEIPNLSARAHRYYLYLIQRYLLGLSDAASPVSASGERSIFLVYGALAFSYRFVLFFGIALYLACEFLIAGVAIATWITATQVVLPLLKAMRFLASSPRLQARRVRAIGAAGLAAASLAVVLFALPAPLVTQAEGVVWVPEQGQIYAPTEGFVVVVLATPGTVVSAGGLLMRIDAPWIKSRISSLGSRLEELNATRAAQWLENRVLSSVTQDAIGSVQKELAQLREKAEALVIKSPLAGLFVSPPGVDLPGRFVYEGQAVGYVIPLKGRIVKAVVTQDRIGLVRSKTTNVYVRLAERPDANIQTTLLRELPAGSRQLPSRALGRLGGGKIPVDALDKAGLTTYNNVFHFELSLPDNIPITGIGGRAYARFDHGFEPLAFQWARALKQLFLSQLAIS